MTKHRVKYLEMAAAERPETQLAEDWDTLDRELLDTLCRLTALLQCLHVASEDDAPPAHGPS